jgi:hypothetical protein
MTAIEYALNNGHYDLAAHIIVLAAVRAVNTLTYGRTGRPPKKTRAKVTGRC